MLHWLAGQKAHEGGDPDTTGVIEPPETPAPVFAVRAFKHALFGTPGTVPAKAPRRHSNTENGKPRPNTRPAMVRPRSTNDAQTIGRPETPVEPEPVPSPMPSPTKGILMTPGTAAARRKTVSFGNEVVDNEGKRAGKSGLPDNCPGKFPSPFVKSAADEMSPSEKPRGRSRLTEALEEVREESAKRKSRTATKTTKTNDELDAASDVAEADSEPGDFGESGEYWKLVYDQYRERTEREVRKLVSKQKAAKSFARDKDLQCTELAEDLRQEKKKTDKLEKLAAELQDKLKLLEEQLRTADAEKDAAVEELARMKRSFGSSGYRRAEKSESETLKSRRAKEKEEELPSRRSERPEPETLRSRRSKDRVEESSTRRAERPAADTLRSRRSKEQVEEPPTATPGDNSTSTETAPSLRQRPRLRDLQTRTTTEDLQPPPILSASSNLSQSKATPSPTSPKPTNPLKPLSPNALPHDTLSVALSMGLQPPSPKRETRADSPMRSPKLNQHPLPPTPTGPPPPPLHKEDATTLPIPSSPSTEWERERPNILTGSPVPIRSAPVRSAKPPPTTTTTTLTTKENVRPVQDKVEEKEENVKPSAAWARISAPAVERAKVPALGLGQVDEERHKAAKARIAARIGREVSG